MEKDLFDYILTPTKKELRKNNCIDKMYSLPILNIPKNGWCFLHNYKDYLVQEAIINYNNEIVMAKYNYCLAIKYHKFYCKTNDQNYDFWSRKYLEQTIKELYSIYDKSMYVINYLFDLRVISGVSFKKEVRNELKLVDKESYKQVNKIYSKLYGDKTKKTIRDNITHNSSDFFDRYIPNYDKNNTSWNRYEAMEYEDIINIIEEISDLLGKNKEILKNMLIMMYPRQ